MSKAIITEQHLHDIADAIIAKGGATEPMTPAQMPAAIQAIPTGSALPWPLNPEWPDIREIMRANRHPTMTYAWIALLPPAARHVSLYHSSGTLNNPNYLTSDGDTLYGDREYYFTGEGYHWVIGREVDAYKAGPNLGTADNVLWMHFDDGFHSTDQLAANAFYGNGVIVSGDLGAPIPPMSFRKPSYIFDHVFDNARFKSMYDAFYTNRFIRYVPDINTEGAEHFENTFDSCISLQRVTDTLDLMSATTSTTNCFYNCVSLLNCPTRLKMNGDYGQTLSFQWSPNIDHKCVAEIVDGVVVGGMAYNLNDLTGSTNPPTVVLHGNIKTAFGGDWQIVKDAFAAKGWNISPA